MGYNRGIFDIFREDLQVVSDPPTEEQNMLVEVCIMVKRQTGR